MARHENEGVQKILHTTSSRESEYIEHPLLTTSALVRCPPPLGEHSSVLTTTENDDQ